jgi:hypothetical protein
MNLYAAAILIPVGVIMYTAHGGLKATFMSTYLHTIVVFIALCLFAFEIYATPNTGLGSPGTVWEHLTDIANLGGAYRGVSAPLQPLALQPCHAAPFCWAACASSRQHCEGCICTSLPLPPRPAGCGQQQGRLLHHHVLSGGPHLRCHQRHVSELHACNA